MFNFLKNKLKEWVDTAKDKLKPEEKPELEEKIAKEKKLKKKKLKKEKVIKKSLELKPEEQGTAIAIGQEIEEGVSQDIIDKELKEKAKKIHKEVPLEFKPGLQKYEPDLEKIEQEITEKLAAEEDVKRVEQEIEKTQEINLKVERGIETPEQAVQELEKEPEKTEEILEKKSFFKKVTGFFGKKEEKSIEEAEKKTNLEFSDLAEPELAIPKTSFFSKLKSTFIYKITQEDFDSLFSDLEMLLLENNVALEVVEDLKKKLSQKLIEKEIKKEDLESEIKKELKNSLNEILIDSDDPLESIKFKKHKKEPFVILFFGINGSGKTTSIAKLAHLLKENNFSVVLAAADTFRAASIEQISEHAKKLKVHLIKHNYGADPSAVGFDAIKYAKAHNIDVVLIDTAGRMHTKTNLLSEMKKICRVTNPDLKIFVAESITGNDATEQARTFNEMIEIDGSILTKADVDEKGGTIISISHATHKPIFYLGTGQKLNDLKLFNKEEFIESLGL